MRLAASISFLILASSLNVIAAGEPVRPHLLGASMGMLDTNGLVARWLPKEGAGTNIAEWSGQSSLKLQALYSVISWSNGPVQKLILPYCFGSTEVAGHAFYTAGNFSNQPTNAITVCGWWKSTSVSGNYHVLISHGDSTTTQGFFFEEVQSGGPTNIFLYGGFNITGTFYSVYASGAPFNMDNNFHHYAFVYDGASVTIYRDAVSLGSTSVPHGGAIGNAAGYPLTFLALNSSGANGLGGQLSDWRVYNYAKKTAELKMMVAGLR